MAIDIVVDIGQHAHLEFGGTLGGQAVEMVDQRRVPTQVHPVGVADRDLDRGPRRRTHDDRRAGLTVDDARELIEADVLACVRSLPTPDRIECLDRLGEQSAALRRSQQVTPNRVVLDSETRPRCGTGPDAESYSARGERLQRIDRRGELSGMTIDHVGDEHTQVNVVRRRSDRTERDERIARVAGAHDRPAEVIGHPDCGVAQILRRTCDIDHVGDMSVERVDREVDEHMRTVSGPPAVTRGHRYRGAVAAVTGLDVDRYLRRIGVNDIDSAREMGVAGLMHAHLTAVPFENLDIVFAGGVPHDPDAAVSKIIGGRGGWCFEVNEAFAQLLDNLGYDVIRLGAAVLLDGPNEIVEHLTLEVTGREIDEPTLVDVGFGDSFIRPLRLNRPGVQHGGDADYELVPSPKGTTLAKHDERGGLAAQYRFKRVSHGFDDFATAAATMQTDPDRHWHRKPFATRLLSAGAGADRVTLTHDRITLRRHGKIVERSVDRPDWDLLLREWFSVGRPGPWPNAAS